MSSKLFKLFGLFLLTLLLFSYAVKSDSNNEDYEDEDEDENDSNHSKSHNNVTESIKSHNTTDDYDYGDINDEEEDSGGCHEKSFVDKLRELHEEGRNTTTGKHVKHINETFDLLRNAQNVFGSLFGIDERERMKFLEFLSEIDLGLSPQCLASFLRVVSAVREREIWGIKFLDAIGRFPPPGFAEGVVADFGEYDECLDIRSPVVNRKNPEIRGQYCLMKVILPFPKKDSVNQSENLDRTLQLNTNLRDSLDLEQVTVKGVIEALNIVQGAIYRLGICIPSNCKPQEVENMLNKIFQPISKLPVEIDPNCQIRDKPIELDNFQILSITILSVLTILVISSTIFEIYKNKQEKENLPITQTTKTNDLLLSFSIIKNTKTLFVRTEKWAALDTIRLLLIVNTYVVHMYVASTTLGLVTLKRIITVILPRMLEDRRYFFVRNPLMIDALFTLSGFLISYGLLRRLGYTKGRFNYIAFVFQQWMRFVLFAFASILFFYLYPLSGEGPIFHYSVEYGSGCKDPAVLMRIFLFINNFNNFSFETFHENCNVPLWFLSSLFQFLLISPFFIILYYKKPKIGVYAMAAAIVFTLFLSVSPRILFGIKTYLEILIHGNKLLTQNVNDSLNWYHTTPNVHAISYFVGVAAGFIMKKNISLSRTQEKFMWIFTVFGIMSMYYWQMTFFSRGATEPVVSALLWHSIGKLMFGICWSWIFFAICTGRAKSLNQVLSWPGFTPIARLSFGIFMLHSLTLAHRIFTVKETFAGDDNYVIKCIIIDMMINVVFSYVFYIMIECPFGNLFRIAFNRKPIQKPVEKPVERNGFDKHVEQNNYINENNNSCKL